MRYDKKERVIFGVSTLAGVIAGAIVLMMINASFLKAPDGPPQWLRPWPPPGRQYAGAPSGPDYAAITKRNLFRAKLQVDIPKQKTAAR